MVCYIELRKIQWWKVVDCGGLVETRVMPMFLGEFQHNMDDKGRVIMPAKFRKHLEDKFIATRGLDNCLFAYPHSEWKLIEEKLNNLPLTKKEARAFVRFFFSGAGECELDKQGRVCIPGNLREHADLKKEIVIIGVSHRIEIWSRSNWDVFMKDAGTSYNDFAEELEDLGI